MARRLRLQALNSSAIADRAHRVECVGIIAISRQRLSNRNDLSGGPSDLWAATDIQRWNLPAETAETQPMPCLSEQPRQHYILQTNVCN